MIRALIVDDEEPARDRLRRLLAGEPITIVGEAADGREAIERIESLAPDLVFLDIQMPGLSGLEVAARLAPPRPRVVFCTAFDAFAIDAFEHHAMDYLLKPVNRQRLLRTVARAGDELSERRRRAKEDEEAARTQARLMPRGSVAELDCAAVCVPAGRIGGDCYDVRSLAGGRVALAVGDVSGKGPYAGLLVAALQARLQAVLEGIADSPSAVMREVNRLTVGTLEDHRFATLFLGLYHGAERTLRCASAGHPPALLFRPGAPVHEVEAGGPAVGWIADAEFPEVCLPVSAGGTLVVYSDGVSEARGAGGAEFGVDRLVQAVGDPAGAPAQAVVERVMGALERFCGDEPANDDRTLLVARVGG